MPPQSQSKNRKIIASFVVILAVVLLAFGASLLTKKDDSTDSQTPATSESSGSSEGNNKSGESGVAYKDGTYEATGSYLTPGGEETIDLTVTIKDNKVVSTSFVSEPKNRQTVEYQGKFKENYTALVVGKNIDEISLTRVSGSSLTSTGFHDALDQIKTQAKS